MHLSFASTVGQFVLTASMRSQVNPENRNEFKDVSPERYATTHTYKNITSVSMKCARAFGDFALGSVVLHFFVYNFLG